MHDAGEAPRTQTSVPCQSHPRSRGHVAAVHQRRPRRWIRNLVIAAVSLEVLALFGWAVLGGSSGPERATVGPAQREAGPISRNAFTFTQTQKDHKKPVAYDPCRPIHYVIRQEGSPSGGRRLISDAVRRVAQATGLEFVYDGYTDERPTPDRAAVQVDRYGDNWAPVLISWVTVKENPRFKGDVAGEAGSAAIRTAGSPAVYVTGTVQLDGPQIGEILSQPRGRVRARAIVLHELGHLVGLGHVKDKNQLMYPKGQAGVIDFAAGDMEGLAALGKGPCVARLQHP